ncbi:Uncharacterized protein FWK35_00012023 [Aphis craccivora]|uniref:Uncharacterized protein n=1 Tax=Aphis craccivora TaxID=307492 RepID=A0A6G0YHB1_APHCR|nr:Uncharacterized protein FWK35_00012023 [Aphis craccivora]
MKIIQDKIEGTKPVVSYDIYRKHFLTSYNLSFGYPRSDTCRQVTVYKITAYNESRCFLCRYQTKNTRSKKKILAFDPNKIYHYPVFLVGMSSIKDNSEFITYVLAQEEQACHIFLFMMMQLLGKVKMRLLVISPLFI